jgi:hypothetical protein
MPKKKQSDVVAMNRKQLNDTPVYRAEHFLGINNVDDPVNIGPNFLQRAINVDIHKDGDIILRPGQTLIASGATKNSIWSNRIRTICLYMDNGSLMRLNKDETSSVIATGFSASKPMNFCDGDGRIWCTNEETIGYIKEGIYYDTFTDPLDYYKVRPMPGNLIDYGHGRLWVVRGDKVWYSDGHRPTQFDLTHNFMPLNGTVTLFRTVTNGIWMANGKIWFLTGTNPKSEMRPIQKADYDVILRTDRYATGDRIGPEGMPDVPIFFLSTKGICLGGVDGAFKNLTDKKYNPSISLMGVRTGTGVIMRTDGINRYVATVRY